VRVEREPFAMPLSRASVVTIGKFDGVHLGHRAVLRRTVDRARARGVEAAAVTFDRNPLVFLRPEIAPPALTSLERRLELIGETGIDVAVVLDFDGRRALQPAEDFVREVLIDGLAARLVLVGSDFRFGAGGLGDPELLERLGHDLGFETEIIDDVGAPLAARVSSSEIRRRIADGRVAEAALLLGSLPSVEGEVVRGNARGRDLGYPTANLAHDAIGVVPADGVYAGYLVLGADRYPAAISVSDNPTFGDVARRRVEAHALDQDFDIYGRTARVEFAERIRGIERFGGVDALIDRMQVDEREARRLLGLSA